MSAITHESAVTPRAPGFLTTVWDVFVGFVLTVISVGVVGLAATLVGILGRTGTTHERPLPLDWPFAHSGAWSTAANAVVTAGVLLTCAWWIADRVGRRAEAPVSIWRTFAIVAFFGYAPYVTYTGLVPQHFVFGLLVTAFLVRRFAVGVEPLAFAPRARVALAVAGVAALCIPVAYGATHPLWYVSEVFVQGPTSGPDWNAHEVVFRPRADTTVRYGFILGSSSYGTVTLLGVSGGHTPFLRVVGAVSGMAQPLSRTRPFRGATVGRHDQHFVTLFVRMPGCSGSSGTERLDRVTIRYRLAGTTFSQAVALAIRPTVRCP